ncbi:LysM peptidoglycan-binding domain-containing protein [Brevibacillus sp. H7]|uniref:LysM peptidoglycan-binding domain-containing protein n=1 Tax=Brevibacillus sp. H7 TaxID=3349138 RepID=UPI00381090E3
MNYTVRPGDTLNSIAARFGVPVQELIRVNNIPYPYSIFVGQNLFIPVRPTPPGPPTPPRDDVDRRLDRLERQVGNLDRRVDRLEQRVNRLEERVDRLEGRPRPRS